jgi:hypothetical protein
MGYQIIHTKSNYPQIVYKYFNFDDLDAFHNKEVLNVIYGSNWESLIISDNDNIFMNSFSRNKINKTEYFDIEPYLGYSGPVVNTNDKNFIEKAVELYSDFCKKEEIIAELIRFNPVLENHKLFENLLIKISPSKELVIVNCHKDIVGQLSEFNRLGKRYIKDIKDETQIYFFEQKNLDQFKNNYYRSLDRVNAGKVWYLNDEFFSRAGKSKRFILVEVHYKGVTKIASIIIPSRLAFYHFITSIDEPRIRGLNDYLILSLSLYTANHGSKYLILGGGNTDKTDDTLLLYKKNFNKNPVILHLGNLIFSDEVFNDFCSQAIQNNPLLTNKNYFLKYRLA